MRYHGEKKKKKIVGKETVLSSTSAFRGGERDHEHFLVLVFWFSVLLGLWSTDDWSRTLWNCLAREMYRCLLVGTPLFFDTL